MTQIQLRRGTAASWASTNPVLALGEVGYETDTLRTKIGNGTTAWNSLGYWMSGTGFVQTIGDGSATTFTVTHNLGTRNVIVSVKRSSTYAEVEVDVAATTVNAVTLTFATAPASNEFFVTVVSAAAAVTSNTVSSPIVTNSGNSLTLPTTNDTLVGRNTVDGLTNKDLSSATNTFPAFRQRTISTVTASTTLPAAPNTEYVVYASNTDPEIGNTVMLYHLNGANNATAITDSSTYGNAGGTAQSGAKISTAQSKFGDSSLLLNGSTDYVTINTPTNTQSFGTGDYTFEAWIYMTAQSNNYSSIYGTNSTYGDRSFYLMCLGTGVAGSARKVRVGVYHGSIIAAIDSTTLINTNTWYHVAVSRASGTTRLFVNGNLEASSTTMNSPIDLGNTGINLGRNSWDGAAGYFAGYIDEARISRVARYTASFTAPSAPFPDTATALTLPTAVGNTSSYVLKNVMGTGNTVTVDTIVGQQTIDGGASLSLGGGSSIRIDSDGANWRTEHAPANVPTSALTLSGTRSVYVSNWEALTTTGTWTDLATTTDYVTATIGSSGMALVHISANMNNNTSGQTALMSFVGWGANTIGVSGRYIVRTGLTTSSQQAGVTALLTGLNPGPTTFKLKYYNTTGTSNFGDRQIVVMPL